MLLSWAFHNENVLISTQNVSLRVSKKYKYIFWIEFKHIQFITKCPSSRSQLNFNNENYRMIFLGRMSCYSLIWITPFSRCAKSNHFLVNFLKQLPQRVSIQRILSKHITIFGKATLSPNTSCYEPSIRLDILSPGISF